MPKQTKDMALFIKGIMPTSILENYSIKPIFKNISNEESIREGVFGFRKFLYRFCDYISNNKTVGEEVTKKTHGFEDNTTLSKDFPLFNNLVSILVNIGFYGELSDVNKSLLLKDFESLCLVGNANLNSKTKMSISKLIEGFRHLKNCGFCFEGINLDEKNPNIEKLEFLKISYPDNPMMLVGMKAMATAQCKLRTFGYQDYFLSCDYKILIDSNDQIDMDFKDFINPLPTDLKDFVMQTDKLFIQSGLTQRVESKYFRIKIIYSYKSKEIFTFSSSINGICFIIKSNNIINFPSIIESFPGTLQQKILKGFGCYRKTGGDHCEGACQGYRFPLDGSFLPIIDNVRTWIEKELLSIIVKR